jgi:molybdopterin/thiamine biosynthesis adenylyltransferase
MDLARYRKQTLLAEIGEAGQARLAQSRVLIVGCGALGSVSADALVRAGVGYVRIVDRDFVDLSNLQRQVLYDEEDVRSQWPKAVAAARKLQRINSGVTIDAHVADVDASNILGFADGIDVIVDGTDNFEVRFLINDAALETGIPWINGGVIGTHGQVMAIVPGRTPCLRCLMADVPDPGSLETCDTAGVLGPAVNVVASLQVVETLKRLVDPDTAVEPVLTVVDVWAGSLKPLKLGADLPERVQCPACRGGDRLWLRGERGAKSTVLCGRNAVQVSPPAAGSIALEDLERRLAGSGAVTRNPFLLRLNPSGTDFEVTVFRDGRAIIRGTEDVAVARGVYARYIGS